MPRETIINDTLNMKQQTTQETAKSGALRSSDWLGRFFRYRERLFSEIQIALSECGGGKSYEGALEIRFPNYFDGDNGELNIHLSCYVLGPSRGYDYRGKTISECLDKAEAQLEKWIQDRVGPNTQISNSVANKTK